MMNNDVHASVIFWSLEIVVYCFVLLFRILLVINLIIYYVPNDKYDQIRASDCIAEYFSISIIVSCFFNWTPLLL